MKFKVGDRVKVREDLKYNVFYGGNRVNEEMFMHRGQILTIRAIDGKNYLMEEDNWYWNDEMFENKKAYTYEDLKKSPIGTKIIFENGDVLMKTREDGDQFTDNGAKNRAIEDLKNLTDNWCGGAYGKIVKIEEPTYQIVYEEKQEILDEAEKRYLRGVIRPFRDKVSYIKKFVYSGGNASIDVQTKDSKSKWLIELQPFKKDKMYKNMEDNKEYTLEELGL